MMRGKFAGTAMALVAGCGLVLMHLGGAVAQGRAESVSTPAAGISPSPPPNVRAASPGVFVQQKRGPDRFHLVLTGRQFTSRESIENYLAWRAAELTAQQGSAWFTITEHRGKTDRLPVPRRDSDGMRYSFRLAFFRPVWRYQLAAAPAAWKSWSPFSAASFWADGLDAKSVVRFQVSADIVLHKGQVADDNPLAFDADAVSDYLVNQVQPPE